MWALKAAIKILGVPRGSWAMALGFSLAMGSLYAVESNAAPKKSKDVGKKTLEAKKSTVGDLLKKIEKKSAPIGIKKSDQALPQFQKFQGTQTKNLGQIKPPSKSKLYFEEGTDEAELEKITDQGIEQLYTLTKRFGKSSKRGELWLRLAEHYVEKSRLIEFRIHNKYDQDLAQFQSGQYKQRPRLNLKPAQEYNTKAIQLYEWFLRDFPKDEKVDQALFFLGYNYFELGDVEKGKSFYLKLTKEHPKSPYVEESNFALAEFYFENEKWAEALDYYMRVARNKKSRLFSFSLYKVAWCQYKVGKTAEALRSMEIVIAAGRRSEDQEDRSTGGVSRIKLASEAIKDLVIFYAEVKGPEEAQPYFVRIAGEKAQYKLLEQLAYYYVDTGNKTGARYVFGEMIKRQPLAPKSYDYQYQIVSLYASAGDNNVFRTELYNWIRGYGPESDWRKANEKNADLVEKATQLIETTLRNYILQMHQTARNSRTQNSQKLAKTGYELYFSSFKVSSRMDEMKFFYGELLFEMNEFPLAARQYQWVVQNGRGGKYYEQSVVNAILALEKKLPTADEVKKIVGESLQAVEFDQDIRAFEEVALVFFKDFPKGDNRDAIKYRLASLYYYYNQFDKALGLFREVIKEYPQTKYAEYSANLILDIYNLKKDYEGLETAAGEILAVPQLAAGPLGSQIQSIRERSAFKQAGESERAKDFLKSAKSYEEFVKKNPRSPLVAEATYNAAVNFEKGGDLLSAISFYEKIGTSKDTGELRKKARRFLAQLYEKVGLYRKAAAVFEDYANTFPKEAVSVDYYFNAAIIRDGLRQWDAAQKNYDLYYQKSRKPDRWEILFLKARIHEKRNQLTLSRQLYEQYRTSPTKNSSGVVEATFNIAKIYERTNAQGKADEWYAKTVAVHRNLGAEGRTGGAAFAAEAKFKLVHKIFDEMRAIRFPRNPKAQGAALKQKSDLMEKLNRELKKVIEYDDGMQIVAALTLTAQAVQHMAAAIYNAPAPSGLTPDELKQYKEGIDKVARPYQEQAIKAYQAAISRAIELQAFSPWLKVALKELNRLDPKQYPDWGEKVFLTKLSDLMDL